MRQQACFVIGHSTMGFHILYSLVDIRYGECLNGSLKCAGHQETDGMFGAMIIREPRDDEFGLASRYDEDLPEHYMIIWHWFDRAATTATIDMQYLSLRREGFGFLINGKGTVQKIYENGMQQHMPMETFRVQTVSFFFPYNRFLVISWGPTPLGKSIKNSSTCGI
jgi:hypothetical protein